MRILFLTSNYPTPSRPVHGTFVRQFVWAMARQGNECVVIRPTSLWERRYGLLPGFFAEEDAGNRTRVKVYFPRYLSFSSKDLKWTHTGRWTQWAFNLAVWRLMRQMEFRPDIVYGHFLYPGGYAAVLVGKKLGVPSVIRVGEGEFWTVCPFGFEKAAKDFKAVSGVIANGSHLKRVLREKLHIPDFKIVICPNGVNRKRFYPHDKIDIRKKLGFALEDFLVAFVGPPVEKKGFWALQKAVVELKDVKLILLGRGMREIEIPHALFKGTVIHEKVPLYLSAADILVLPTHVEGSCNAVIEAMACGLPIVTAQGEHMDDIVDDSVAIRVDPTDVQAIRSAILKLKNNLDLRQRMSKACLEKAKEFDINQRARRVTEWMTRLVEDYRDSSSREP